jgi:hypothetical protein
MVISGTSINLSSWNFDPIDDDNEVALNASLGDDPENESEPELGNSSVKEDAFSQMDSNKKVHELSPSSRSKTNPASNLDIGGLGIDSERNGLDISNTADRDKYLEELMSQFKDSIQEAIEKNDNQRLEEISNEMQKKIEEDFNNGVIDDRSVRNGEDSFSRDDIERAAAEAEQAQRDVLNDLRNKASGAGGRGAGGNNEGGFDGSDLERQARIDKWEALKDQQMVYYLKATLAGIKASQSLAKSVQ